jgi:transcriptional regulator with XRE-family HTH domain
MSGDSEVESMAQALARGIFQARKASGLSQETASRAAGLSRTQLQRLEAGVSGGQDGKPADPHLSTIVKLAVALKVPPAALLFPPDNPDAPVEVATAIAPMFEAYAWFCGLGKNSVMAPMRERVTGIPESDVKHALVESQRAMSELKLQVSRALERLDDLAGDGDG